MEMYFKRMKDEWTGQIRPFELKPRKLPLRMLII